MHKKRTIKYNILDSILCKYLLGGAVIMADGKLGGLFGCDSELLFFFLLLVILFCYPYFFKY